MRFIVRAARTLVTTALLGCVAVLAYAFVPTLFGSEASIVMSGSMEPAIPVGSIVSTRLVDVGGIGAGDVVSFRRSEERTPITHRVVAVEEEAGARVFTTKGDANEVPDPELLRLGPGRVARMERVVPYAGYIVRYAKTPAGATLLFFVPILGLARDRRRARRSEARARQRRRVHEVGTEEGWSASTLALCEAWQKIFATASEGSLAGRREGPAAQPARMASRALAGQVSGPR